MWIYAVIGVSALLVGIVAFWLVSLKGSSDDYGRLRGRIDSMANEVLKRKSMKHEDGDTAHRIREAELEFVLELLSNLKR